MAKIYVPSSMTDPSIEVGGDCYRYIGPSANPVDTLEVDAVFDSCELCLPSPSPTPPSPSPSPVPSPSPSIIPACPSNCPSCCDYELIISGLAGGCAILNGTYHLTQEGVCEWTDVPASVTIYTQLICIAGNQWQLLVWDYGSNLLQYVAPNIDGCPPSSGWVDEGVGNCLGTFTLSCEASPSPSPSPIPSPSPA